MLPRLSIHTFVSVEHLYNFPILPLFSVTTLCLTTPPSTNNQRRNVLTNFYVKQPKNKMPFDMSGKTISQLTQAHFEPYIKQATKTKDKNAAYDPVNQSQHPNQIDHMTAIMNEININKIIIIMKVKMFESFIIFRYFKETSSF